MLRERIITAIVLISIIAGTLIWLPPWAFQILVLLAVLFSIAELGKLALSRLIFYRVVALVVGMMVAIVQSFRPVWLPLDLAIILAVFILALVFLWRTSVLEGYTERLAMAVFGPMYVGLTLPYLGLMRLEEHGVALLVMTLAMIACSDSAAYSIGRTFGKRKLAAQTSPNKTLEGFIAGFFGSVLSMLACRALFWPEFPLIPAIVLGLIIGFVAPMGDLIESAIKRSYHVKDSGNILPGHGGLLDRCDAYYFSAPIVYYFYEWFVRVS